MRNRGVLFIKTSNKCLSDKRWLSELFQIHGQPYWFAGKIGQHWVNV